MQSGAIMTTATASQPATQLPSLIPREILFGNPERARPQLSPDGQYLSYIAPDEKNILQVWLRTWHSDVLLDL